MRHTVHCQYSTLLIGIFFIVMTCPFTGAVDTRSAGQTASTTSLKRTLHYSMSGRVRLLLFWIGRNGVGGGTVTLESARNMNSPKREEKITVLFGTKPERVPGRINRWGYGEEIGHWDSDGGLAQSMFTGFIRHSPEESISQLSSSSGQEGNDSRFWYDGISSIVKPDEAQTEIFYFPMVEEVTREGMDSAIRAFESRRRAGAPDKSNKLQNRPPRYDSPQGFLLTLKQMLAEATRIFSKAKKNESWVSPQLRSAYIYNAKLYELRLKRARLHKSFRLNSPDEGKRSKSVPDAFNNVAEAEFEITNLANGESHSFLCWFPTEGPLESIPIQIQDNPRWWLQVRLQLAGMEDINDHN